MPKRKIKRRRRRAPKRILKRPTWPLWVSAIALVVFILSSLLYMTPKVPVIGYAGEQLIIDIEGDTTPPANINDLATSDPTTSSITLTWTAPGDDGSTGTASQYDIRYRTDGPIDDIVSWSEAAQVPGELMPTPSGAAGTSESFTVTGLSLETTYYFAIKTADEIPNWSGLSNSPSGTTLGEQLCTGEVELTLPSSALAGEDVTASITGLSNCSGKTVYIKEDTCDGATACTITLTDGSGSCDFTAPAAAEEEYLYAACIDINNDADFEDAGESDSVSIASTAVCPQPPPERIVGDCIAGERNITEWGCDTTTGEWSEVISTEPCAVCGDDVCDPVLGETQDTCCLDCGCPTGEECIDNTCVSLEPEAKAAIDLATATITAAIEEDKNVTAAQAMVQEAIAAYNAGEYATAKTKAEAARLAAEIAPKIERPIVELPVLIMIISAIVAIAGIAYYFKRRPKAVPAVPPAPPAPTPS